MKTTADFLDELRVKLEVNSDNALGLKLNIRRQTMSEYRTLKTTFNDETCLRFAEILETDPENLIAAMHHQREKNEELRKMWERIAKRLAHPAALASYAVMALTLTYVTLGAGNGADKLSLQALLSDPGSLAVAGFVLPQAFRDCILCQIRCWTPFFCTGTCLPLWCN